MANYEVVTVEFCMADKRPWHPRRFRHHQFLVSKGVGHSFHGTGL